jgi:hypothetical protein
VFDAGAIFGAADVPDVLIVVLEADIGGGNRDPADLLHAHDHGATLIEEEPDVSMTWYERLRRA